MGILKHLLFWPVTGSLFLTDFALRQVHGVARGELTDENAIKAEMLELQLRLEVGEIDDLTYAEAEAELIQRLRQAREWRERFGLGVTGGVVRVAAVSEEAAEPTAEAPGDMPPAPPAQRPFVADPGSASIEIHLDRE